MHAGRPRTFHTIGLSLLALFVWSFLLMFAWNSCAPDLFQTPGMTFKQAFGLVLFISCTPLFWNSRGKHALFRNRELRRGELRK